MAQAVCVPVLCVRWGILCWSVFSVLASGVPAVPLAGRCSLFHRLAY